MIYRLSDIPEHLREFFEPAHDIEIGLEPTLGEHLAVMVGVFEEIRRVLKPSGTCWVNYGDCYANDGKWGGSTGGKHASGVHGPTGPGRRKVMTGLKPKDLCMVPNRLAIALQEAGWWVRSEIIWAKPNPMPESIRDRPATSHEKIFLLTKSGGSTCWRHRSGEWRFALPEPDYRWIHGETGEETETPQDGPPWRRVNLWSGYDYFYDAGAVRQGRVSDENANGFRGGSYVGGEPGRRTAVGNIRVSKQDATAASADAAGASSGRRMAGFNARWDAAEKKRAADLASPRHAGHINHTNLDATPRGEGRNLRNYEPAPLAVWPIATKPFSEAHFATFPPELAERCILAGCPKGGLVLDPFGGAGTTALAALRHGRLAALIELNPDYAAIARKRIETEWRALDNAPAHDEPLPLFGGQS
ncbi:MAG: site-specific DNA-methyltransferase [Rhodobiaceae bacterium]|nr:site-specific DNA-methyltransferase [Rhodobiaceae bacterium]MCC0055893.1 site-specific DNA-methyltransferase [Rhodobiaceae bacterium]